MSDRRDDEDLRLNTLHRFAKHSPSLLLQEYSHCEVPAGCGGVVLRWLDPHGGVPVLVQVASLGSSKTWLDGAELSISHVMLGMGRHVIAVHLFDDGSWPKGQRHVLPAPFSIGMISDAEGAVRDLVPAAAARWRWSDRKPVATWVEADFDDSRWFVPTGGAALVASLPEGRGYSFERALERGQAMFAMPGREAWIRVTFTLSAAAIASAGTGGAR